MSVETIVASETLAATTDLNPLDSHRSPLRRRQLHGGRQVCCVRFTLSVRRDAEVLLQIQSANAAMNAAKNERVLSSVHFIEEAGRVPHVGLRLLERCTCRNTSD